MRNNSADTKVAEEGGGGGAPDTRDEIFLQPMERLRWSRFVPLQPTEDHGEADIHTAARRGPHAAADGHSLKEAAASGEPTLVQAPGSSYSLQRGAHTGAGGEHEEKGAAERNCCELIVTPVPHPPCTAQDGVRSKS